MNPIEVPLARFNASPARYMRMVWLESARLHLISNGLRVAVIMPPAEACLLDRRAARYMDHVKEKEDGRSQS